MKIRKEKLHLDELRAYDMSVPLVSGVKRVIPYEEAFATMCSALQPLGEDYIKILQEFKNARYMDVRETPGKDPVPIISAYTVFIPIFC